MPGRIPFHKPIASSVPLTPVKRTAERLADNRFYASSRWRRLRRLFLAEHPLCEECRKAGRLTPAEHVHHRRERKAAPELAFEWSNLEAVCPPCHNALRGAEA